MKVRRCSLVFASLAAGFIAIMLLRRNSKAPLGLLKAHKGMGILDIIVV
jgi:hypothetical protein